MPRPGGQLERSLAALTIGVHAASRRRGRTLADSRTGEYEQQVHVPLSGLAEGWTFVDRDVNWEWPFVHAPLQRRVPFKTPHFTYGVEMLSASDLVIVTAHVERWAISEEGWFTGATVRFASTAPLASSPVAFSALAHLSFEGYATYSEGDEFTL